MRKYNLFYFIFFLFSINVHAKIYSYLLSTDLEFNFKTKKFEVYENSILIDSSNFEILKGHVISPFVTCKKSGWLCIFNDDINLAIPTKLIEVKSQWTFGELIFKREILKKFYGNKNIFRIVSIEKNNKKNFSVYYYSKERGLIAFSILYGKVSETYWSVDKNGYNCSR